MNSHSKTPLLCAAALLLAVSFQAQAAPVCQAALDSTDAMTFSVKDIPVSKSCKTFTITLKHTGKLPKASMGHNIVITSAADMAAVASDGMKAGLPNQYVKPKDARVIAFSPMIGGGETTKLTFAPAKLSGPSVFFCSFPGHSSIMKGSITLTP